jgi:hypothetical protein
LHATLVPTEPLSGPREVVITGERNAVELLIDRTLRAHGFTVKRFVRTADLMSPLEGGGAATVKDPLTKYVIEGSYGIRSRCPEGGFWFTWIKLDVIDLAANEVVLSMIGNDVFSEGCSFSSGPPPSLFGDFATELERSWQDAKSASPKTPDNRTKI